MRQDAVIPALVTPHTPIHAEMTRYRGEDLRHDTGRHAFVGPQASVNKLPCSLQLVVLVEDLRRQADHATCETGQVLRFWDEVCVRSRPSLDCTGHEHLLVSRVERLEEEIRLGGLD